MHSNNKQKDKKRFSSNRYVEYEGETAWIEREEHTMTQTSFTSTYALRKRLSVLSSWDLRTKLQLASYELVKHALQLEAEQAHDSS